MDCETTHEDLDKLRMEYGIPNDIKLKIPSKSNTPSRPSRGYVTLHFEYFRLGVKLPLQPYFTSILGKLNISLVNSISDLWDGCVFYKENKASIPA